MIKTQFDEKEEIYLIGGLNTQTHISGSSTIYKLMNDTDGQTRFKAIPTTLQYGRAYQIALPISYSLVKESCH